MAVIGLFVSCGNSVKQEKKEVEVDSYQVINLKTKKILSEGSLEFISNDMDYYRESRFRIESLRFLHQHNLLEHFIHM